MVPECNSLGLSLIDGRSLAEASAAMRGGAAKTVIVLENDHLGRMSGIRTGDQLDTPLHLIVIDHLNTATAAQAEIVLPAATFAEGDGTLVNNEGRAQRFYQAFVPEGEIQESWRWLRDLMMAISRTEAAAWSDLDAIDTSLAAALPIFQSITEIAPGAGFRIAGQRIPRQPARYSGRTAIAANISVHEPGPPADPDSPLAFSMEGYTGEPPPALIPRFWAPGWNSIQALNRFQEEVGGALRGGDPGRRLIEPPAGGQRGYFTQIPLAFVARADEWLVLLAFHIFGSEELSMLTPGVAQLAPQPYIGLNPADATHLGAADGNEIALTLQGLVHLAPVRLVPTLPAGIALVPAGLPGRAEFDLPDWGLLNRLDGVTGDGR